MTTTKKQIGRPKQLITEERLKILQAMDETPLISREIARKIKKHQQWVGNILKIFIENHLVSRSTKTIQVKSFGTFRDFPAHLYSLTSRGRTIMEEYSTREVKNV